MHQRREVQGRAKDFDVLVAELKANSRKGESPKEKSPGRKEPTLERPSQEPPSSVQAVAAATPSSTFSARAKQTYPYCALPRYVRAGPHLGTLGPKPSRTPGNRPRESPSAPRWGDSWDPGSGAEVGDPLLLPQHAAVPQPL